MTPEEQSLFETGLYHVEIAFEACAPDAAQDSFEMINLEKHRDNLRGYVNSLLAAKDAEIERLRARQITPEIEEAYHAAQASTSMSNFYGNSAALLMALKPFMVDKETDK